MSPAGLFICGVFICWMIFYLVYSAKKQAIRLEYIQNYQFHPAIVAKLKKKYPHLNDLQLASVMEGLRDYFYCCNQAKGKMVAMPSQVVDEAWHEFILFLREYQTFCDKAFGRLLYHTPAEAMKKPTTVQEGIKRTWRLACYKENIDPAKPSRIPRLFAIDQQLAIAGGFIYSLNCDTLTTGHNEYCVNNIGCGGGGCGGGSGDGGGGCGDAGGCGGGCGGCGGCGG